MTIQLSDHFTYKKLLRFCFPPIVMMMFTSIYGVVDGLFVSNFVGKIPFAAINLVMPFVMILGGFGFMIGTGGSALVAKTLGENDKERANRYFTMMIQLTLCLGVVLSVVGVLFIRPISYLLGATDSMIEDCVLYGRVVLSFNTAFMLQNVFQTFLAAAEKPKLGLAATVAAGVTNMALDALFIVGFGWGVAGAALATATGDESEAEFGEGKAAFYQNGTWEYSNLTGTFGMDPADLAMIPIYCGVDGEEKAGLCAGTENCWAINNESSEEDIQATIDFLVWVVTSDEGTTMLAEEFGPCPFKDAKDPENVFFQDANKYTAEGNYVVTWAFNWTPAVDDWRAAVVDALTQYTAGTGDWSAVETAFVQGWATQYAKENA